MFEIWENMEITLKSIQPLKIAVLLKETIFDDLVVFNDNDQGETHFIPHQRYLRDSRSIIFSVHHLSDIGIGTGQSVAWENCSTV